MEQETAQLAPRSAEKRTLDIGQRVAALRQERGWTLQQASASTGVSVSALSKIERNELSPTVSTLQRLASGFGMDVVTLIDIQDGGRSLAGRRAITRANEGRTYQSNSCNNEVLCADLREKRMTPIRTRVTARSPEDYGSWPVSDTEIFVTVISGTMIVHSEIYEPVRLNRGDCMYYDASTPHVWTSDGDEDAVVVWVMTT